MKRSSTPPSPNPPALRLLESSASGLHLATPTHACDLRLLAPDLFRLVVYPRDTTPPPSFAVVRADWPHTPSQLRQRGTRISLETSHASWDCNLANGHWQLRDRHNLEIFRTCPASTPTPTTTPRLALRLAERECLFGLGESSGTFDRRGLIREFWNIDVLGHSPAIHPGLRSLYVSIPFAISLRDGRAAGLFWDNPGRQSWDLGATHPDRWEMTASTGVLDLYLFAGPTVEQVVHRYTDLTGRIPLPPRWALGYQQSRYSYETREELEAVARQFRRRRLPCDVLYCDIHHLDGHRVFTFGKAFPQPANMIRGLARQGFKLVTIVNPGVKEDPRFGVFKRGQQRSAFVRKPSGRADFRGEVWPGKSRFPDFFHAPTRSWWAEEQQTLLRLGVAGIWNDMNEPANFARPDKTLDPDCRHRTDHGPRRHAEIHNAYGQCMAQATHQGFDTTPSAPRPFVLTRAGYAGIQRHAAVWTGDNSSCWEHLADSLRQILALGLGGVSFAGADVGGFLDHATPELFLRWLQMAVFTPFLRNHSNIGTRRQEPWAFGPQVEDITRDFLNLRYQLLPYLYGLFAESARTGTPVARPLLWHFPGDPNAVACSDQFLLGPNLLVCPILQPGTHARSVYLPRGEWFDFWTGAKLSGGTHLCADAPLERIPLFLRAGTILPLVEARPFVGPREPNAVVLHVWPHDHAQLVWYDDDGRTQAHQHGASQLRTILHHPTPRGGRLHFGAPIGPYPGHTRTWRVILRARTRPARVVLDSNPIESQWIPELSLVAFDIPARTQPLTVRWS